MKKIETEIIIDAPVTTVWQVLTDFEQHPTWNPFIKKIAGQKVVGQPLTVSIQPPQGKGMTFRPVIVKFETNREFRWKGKLGINGIFDGEHFFLLEDLGNGKTKFVHGELFSGILVPLLGNALQHTREGFIGMNEALKQTCEHKNR